MTLASPSKPCTPAILDIAGVGLADADGGRERDWKKRDPTFHPPSQPDMSEKYSGRPRLAHVVKWSDFNGYGFNLHAEKGKAGQYIGKVDEGSPAEAAGLCQGDRIVEVNEVNIGNENHQQVVQRIKAGGDEARLLVVDAQTDALFKEQKIVVRGDMPQVAYIKATRPGAKEDEVHVEPAESSKAFEANDVDFPEPPKNLVDNDDATSSSASVHSGGVSKETVDEFMTEATDQHLLEPVDDIPLPEPVDDIPLPEPVDDIPLPEPVDDIPLPEPVDDTPLPEPVDDTPLPEPVDDIPLPEPEPVAAETLPEPVSKTGLSSAHMPTSNSHQTNGDMLGSLNMTAIEMRKHLQSKRKADPRVQKMDMREKYNVLENL